jgi:hypothetical protein
MGYFGRANLPKPMSTAARIRILDSMDGVTGVVRVISAEQP